MRIILLIILTALSSFFVFGQRSSQSPPIASSKEKSDQPIKVNTLLLNMPVIASDREGRNIGGLTKEDFVITQNGEKQPIAFFADAEAPMSVAIVVDLSASTAKVLNDIKSAARDFINTLRPEDKAMIIGFDREIYVLCDLTSDQKRLRSVIDRTVIAKVGGSNMQDALYGVLTEDFAKVRGRKAIIVLTDGFVEGRRISNLGLLNTAAESDSLIYPIFFQTAHLFPSKVKSVTYEELVKVPPVSYLDLLSRAAGGRLYAAGATDFKTSFQSIADELKKQYLVGFYPPEVEAGKQRDIKIEVNRKDVIIRTKRIIRLKSSN